MPTRLEVLLQRRKSAEAGLFHRHRSSIASAGIKPAVERSVDRLGRWEFAGIIQLSYIKSFTISRQVAGTVNGEGGIFGQHPRNLDCRCLFALRYGKICDNAQLIYHQA